MNDESAREAELGSRDSVHRLVESTSDPAYAVDARGYLTVWNMSAEHLFGYSREEAVRRPCHELVRGQDVFGNRYCGPRCPLFRMVLRTEPVRHFQMEIRRKDGRSLRVLCFIVVAPGPTPADFSIIHLLRPVERPMSIWPNTTKADRPNLTERELEVLHHLAEGASTDNMATSMNISTSTVRKHVQSILRKLRVKSRLAAVLAALESQIL